MTTMTPGEVQQELQQKAEWQKPAATTGQATYQRGQLGQALAAARDDMRNLKKSGYNKHDGYEYFTAADLNEACKRALRGRGISIIPRIIPDTLSVKQAQNDYGKTKIHVWAVWEFEITNGVESFIGSEPGYGLNHDDKAMRQASVMAQKGFLQNLLLINDTDDAEATDAEGNSTRQAPPPQQQTQEAPPQQQTQEAPPQQQTQEAPPAQDQQAPPPQQQTQQASGGTQMPEGHRDFKLKFGKHEGKPISHPDIDVTYLEWLLDNSFDPSDAKYGKENERQRWCVNNEINRRKGTLDGNGDSIPF